MSNVTEKDPSAMSDAPEYKNPFESLGRNVEGFVTTFRETYNSLKGRMKEMFKNGTPAKELETVHEYLVQDLDSIGFEAAFTFLDTLPPNEVLNPEILHNPGELIAKEIEVREGNCFVLFGEDHHELGVLGYERQLLIDLRNRGIEIAKVFMEEDEAMQPYVDEFMSSGEVPTKLVEYLTTGFVRVDTSVKHTEKLKLLETARAVGAKVIFIDQNSHPDRDADWFNKIVEETGEKLEGVNILYAGRNHASRKMGPKPLPNAWGDYMFNRNVGDYLSEKFPGQTVHIIGEGINPNYPDGHQYQSIPGRLMAKKLNKLGRYKDATAARLSETAIGYFPLSSVPGRTAQAANEFDIIIVVPSEYAG